MATTIEGEHRKGRAQAEREVEPNRCLKEPKSGSGEASRQASDILNIRLAINVN